MDSIILALALLLTFISVESLSMDLVMGVNKNADFRLISKILACILWGLFHFVTH